MTLNEYQRQAATTALPLEEYSLVYAALKLPGEAGELSEKLGKLIRDDVWRPGQRIPYGKRSAMAQELGDVLWYVSLIAKEPGFTLEQVAKGNLEKLQSRAERGVLSGDGDNR